MAAIIVIALSVWPWALALLDLAMWAATGAQWSSVPWGDTRGIVLLCWPRVCAWLAGMLGY